MRVYSCIHAPNHQVQCVTLQVNFRNVRTIHPGSDLIGNVLSGQSIPARVIGVDCKGQLFFAVHNVGADVAHSEVFFDFFLQDTGGGSDVSVVGTSKGESKAAASRTALVGENANGRLLVSRQPGAQLFVQIGGSAVRQRDVETGSVV